MTEKRLKDEIKELKYWIRIYKKEAKENLKSNDVDAHAFCCEKILNMELQLNKLQARYKKEA
jgi:hypothetical protein